MSDAAAAATQPRSGGAAKGGNRACFKCGKTGHWSKDCTAPREEWIPQQPRAEAGVPQSPTDVGAAEGEDGAPAKPAPAAKKRSNRKPKFTAVEHLLGPNGVSYVYDQIPEKFAAIAKGPGHELGDFARLVGLYREWTRKMYPHTTHEEVMKKVRTHSKTREVRATVREFKEKARLEAGGDPEDAPPPDFEAEDVFFPDEEEDDDDDVPPAGGGKDAGDGDDEEEWNDAVHGGEGGGDDEDEELAILMEQERAFAKKSRKTERAREAAFDEARDVGAEDANDANVDVNFDESSEDDDDFESAAPRAGGAARAAPGERGKARKKVKARAGRRRGKKAEAAEAREAAEAAEETPEAAAEEAAETGRVVSPRLAPAPEGRKKLGGRRNRSKRADEDSDDSDEDAGDAAGDARRPRRKVATALDDSDDDDDDDAAPLPTTMGGDAFDAEPLPADARPSFLYDSDSDDGGGVKRKAEAEAEAE